MVRFGYRRLTEASFLLLTIRDASAARAWLRTAPVTDAVAQESAPSTALQIAFTADGLYRLGLSDELLTQFSAEFLAGMSTSASRSRLLGDTGANAPEHWTWGNEQRTPHVAVLLYAQPGHLHAWSEALQDERWNAAFEVMQCLPTVDMDGVEPFGFSDGVSQPVLDWERTRASVVTQAAYTNVARLGEFLLGYPNEYGRYTERPLLEATAASASLLPKAEDQPGCRDLGRNGCYLVMRSLEQDVQGFRNFLETQAGSEPRAQVELAAAMVGRWPDGSPLVALSDEPIAGVENEDAHNRFTFDNDKKGLACPFGAHIRRANPRNADLPTPPVHGLERLLQMLGLGQRDLRSDAKASTRFHRLLRRGREYGPRTNGEPGGQGIHFIALVANISRQFEFLQNAWMMSSKFDAGTEESDPLLGNREPVRTGSGESGQTDTFSRPGANGLRERLEGLPRFVTVRGGAYFFLPSLAALRYLAALDGAED